MRVENKRLDSRRTVQDGKHVVNLQKLVCRPGPPPLLLGFPIVDISLVLGRLAHGDSQTIPTSTENTLFGSNGADQVVGHTRPQGPPAAPHLCWRRVHTSRAGRLPSDGLSLPWRAQTRRPRATGTNLCPPLVPDGPVVLRPRDGRLLSEELQVDVRRGTVSESRQWDRVLVADCKRTDVLVAALRRHGGHLNSSFPRSQDQTRRSLALRASPVRSSARPLVRSSARPLVRPFARYSRSLT